MHNLFFVIKCKMKREKPNLGIFTETWSRDTIGKTHLNIRGYHSIARNRISDIGSRRSWLAY